MSNMLMHTETILENLHFSSLNPMQLEVQESFAEHNEIILLSNTGSGKTLAFLIPLIQSIDIQNPHPQGLIMSPSRELALQIESVIKQIRPGCKISCCYGGHKREIEENNLIEPPAIIIATAGRMADHIRRGNINTAQIHFLVLDEFDKILELDFQAEMEFILSKLTGVKRKILTSATQAISLPDYVNMNSAYVINCLSDEKINSDELRINTLQTIDKDKIDTLFILLCSLKDTSTIVFCNHRDAVERTHELLGDKGILSVFYHGGMEQIDRETALCKFKNGTSNILITTDLASRGLDILNIRSVVHYHIPHTEASFTHRNGRTARMDATGNVYVIVGPDEETPDYIQAKATPIVLPEKFIVPEKPKWSTLFIAAGKKDKINKIDIVGFLTQRAHLKKDDIGLIDVKDFSAFVAVRKSKIGLALEAIKDQKIKNKKVKIAIAK
jgi:ATP-independent RNA helicase DbpA